MNSDFFKDSKDWVAYLVIAAILGAAYFSGGETMLGNSILNIATEPLTGPDGQDVRSLLERCSADLYSKAPILGHGVGDAKPLFNQCLEKYNPELAAYSFNTHNQFTGIILMTGVIGLLLFLVQSVYIINRAMRAGDKIILGIVMYLLIIMFSENLLERENGVLLFAYFVCFMASHVQRGERMPKFGSKILRQHYGNR